MKKLIVVLVLAGILFAAFGAGVYFGKSQAPAMPPEGVLNPELGKRAGVDFSLFWEAWNKLEEKYVDHSKVDYRVMLYGAIAGMTNSLKDDYTVFFPPEDTKIFKEDVSGEFSGVGMEIGMRNNTLTVIAPLEGTPAERAGLRAGDKILKINGDNTGSMSVDSAVKLIRGPKGTEITLTIVRDGWDDVKDFKIIRDAIEVPSLKWETKEGNIAYIKLYHFSEVARSAFNKAGLQILNSSPQKIILDLRNNPGGYLEVANDIGGWFLEKGQLITIEDFGGKETNIEYRANGPSSLLQFPIVVLINKGSASASEILAGALRDNRQALLIGEKSFGKGSVQQLEDLSEGSLKITIAKWLTPKGTAINGEGLSPDIEVELTENDYKEGKDPQLDKAIEILNEMK